MHYYYMFRPSVTIIRHIQYFIFTIYLCLLHLPTLTSVYTLGMCCKCKKLYVPDDGHSRPKHVVTMHNVQCIYTKLCRRNNGKHYLTHNMKLQCNISKKNVQKRDTHTVLGPSVREHHKISLKCNHMPHGQHISHVNYTNDVLISCTLQHGHD
jgi:hypothetical protein